MSLIGVLFSVSYFQRAGSQIISERPAGVLATNPWQYPACGLKISHCVVEAVRDAVCIDIADQAVVPTELLDKVATDRDAAFGIHYKSS
jgi:hypothetical protein